MRRDLHTEHCVRDKDPGRLTQKKLPISVGSANYVLAIVVPLSRLVRTLFGQPRFF
jgi:hypothetical protein